MASSEGLTASEYMQHHLQNMVIGQLPAGYVRHHQATDDGQRIEPILMFAPDTPTLVINGRTITVPADRVVTPELAPPGLPIRRIVVPAPVDGPR